MNRESGIFRNEFVRNDSRKNRGNLQKFIWRDPAPASVFVLGLVGADTFDKCLFNRPSTPQFGQPSRVAPAGRAPRAQWKKKNLGNKG
jgi:hypothetical protein